MGCVHTMLRDGESHFKMGSPRAYMGTGAMLFAVAALLGLNAVLMAVPKLYGVMKLAGGIYLAYLGVRLWQGAMLPLDVSLDSSPRLASDTRRHYFLGLFTQVSNPKTAIVYASVFAAFLPASPSLGFCALVCALVFVVEVGWYATIAMALSSERARATYLRCRTPIDRLSGAIMAALGAKLVASGLND